MGTITGHTGLLALIGSPVGHSGSPAIYNYLQDRVLPVFSVATPYIWSAGSVLGSKVEAPIIAP